MKNSPLVSILMTAYNREQYIAEAIESVLASTYYNFELLIVDDASADKTVEIARHYESRDPRIKVYVNNLNIGDYPNRNKAASYAKGKYLKYLDSDDIIYPHGLEVMVAAMEKFPDAAIGMPAVSAQNITPFPILILPKIAYRRFFFGGNLFLHGPSALIFLAKPFFENGGFGKETYVGSDVEIQLKIGALYPIVQFQPSLIWWRIHQEQEFLRGSDSFEYLVKNYPVLIKALQRDTCPLSYDDRNLAIILQKKLQSRRLLKLALLQWRPGMAYKIFISSKLSLLDLLYCLIPNRLDMRFLKSADNQC